MSANIATSLPDYSSPEKELIETSKNVPSLFNRLESYVLLLRVYKLGNQQTAGLLFTTTPIDSIVYNNKLWCKIPPFAKIEMLYLIH